MKKLFISLFCILTSLAISTTVFAAELGDVNSDSQINASDALAVLKHAARIENADTTLSDVSKDGVVDSTDALLILKYAARLIPDFSLESINKPTPSDNIEKLKNHIKTNGTDDGDGIPYISYSYGDTVYVTICYSTEDDILWLNTSYAEYIESDNLSILATANLYDLGGENIGDYYEEFYYDEENLGYFCAEATIYPLTLTSADNINFTEYESLNYSDEDKTVALDTANQFFHTALYAWEDVIKTETGLTLKDLGFTNYVPSIN